MQTYYIASKPIHRGGRAKMVRAANIDNLRRNLIVKMKKIDKVFVYSDMDGESFIGLIGNIGKDAKGWPNYVWISKGIDYEVNPSNGMIRRL